MNFAFKENQLNYETYYTLRKSVEWNNWSKEQAEIALKNSYYTVTVFDNTCLLYTSQDICHIVYKREKNHTA